jgi:molybdate transport system ATP-binding protein
MKDPARLRFRATKLLRGAHGPLYFDVSFECDQGRLLAIYGPSGAGKTTLLRILAGLTHPDSGLIEIGAETWLDTARHLHLATRHRSIGLVFQDFALFPHLTVRQQLEYALPQKGDKTLITELIDLMELGDLQRRRPVLLSGGQQQRVAIARAIARRPRLLLLDEPLSALDDEMRWKLQDYIGKVHRHFGLTTLLVSHSLPEIFSLADEVIHLERGKIKERGVPASIFHEDHALSKIRLIGEIIDILPGPTATIVHVLAAGTIIKVVEILPATADCHIGQKVILVYKNFNPIILPAM